jgi:hypothetical protein
MSTSFEILDPRQHVMVHKASDQSFLLNENKNLMNLNLIIMISALVIISVGVVYYRNENNLKKNENE